MGWDAQSLVSASSKPQAPSPGYGYSHGAEEAEEGRAETDGLREAPPAEGKVLQGPREHGSAPCTPTQPHQEPQPARACLSSHLRRAAQAATNAQCFILKEGTASISLCSPSKLPAPHSSCLEAPSCGGMPSQPSHLLAHKTSCCATPVCLRELLGGPSKARALRNCIPLKVTLWQLLDMFPVNWASDR